MKGKELLKYLVLLLIVATVLQFALKSWWESNENVEKVKLWLDDQSVIEENFGRITSYQVVKQVTSMQSEENIEYTIYTIKVDGIKTSGTIRVKTNDDASILELVLLNSKE